MREIVRHLVPEGAFTDILVLASVVVAVGCSEGRQDVGASPSAVRELAAGCVDGWDPGWRQGGGANAWWAEYLVDASGVASVALEVQTDAGVIVVELMPEWGKWVGETGFAIPRGAEVVVRARSVSGAEAETWPFPYLDEGEPLTRCRGTCVPSCEGQRCGDDRCGGSCGLCAGTERCTAGMCVELPADPGPGVPPACDATFAPLLTQGVGANEWWIEYRVESGDIASVTLEGAGVGLLELRPHHSKWAASPGQRLAAGTLVVLHVTSTSGASAESEPFAYLREIAPPLAPCEGGEGEGEGEGECPPPTGMVTLQFDDNAATQYTLARPALRARGLVGELVLVVQPFVADWPGYLTLPEARAFVADGGAIIAHGMEHVPLSTLQDDDIHRQLRDARLWLEEHLDTSVPHYAAPDGEADADGIAIAPQYYASYRAARGGLNAADVGAYAIESDVVFRTTPPSEVLGWVEEARARAGWRVLVFHRFTTGAPDAGFPPQYSVAAFEEILDGIVASGVDVVTTEEALARLRCGAP